MSALSRVERAVLFGVLLATLAAGLGRYIAGFPAIPAFFLAAAALAGHAWVVSTATHEVGSRLGSSATGLLQATLGNLPEFFVVIFALNAGEKIVAETAILGSILANSLLVLGFVLIVGSHREPDGKMRFRADLPKDTATLMLIVSFIIVLVRLSGSVGDAASKHIGTISVIAAAVILVVYVIWVQQYLRAEPAEDEAVSARLTLGLSLALLAAAGLGSAFVSDWLIHALAPTIRSLGISRSFAGLVIVAIGGNAVEHATGVVLAARGRANLAIAVVKNSVAQVAAFLYPLLVIVSLLTSTRLTFGLAPVYVGALIISAILAWQITGDGEATVFEGSVLVATFVLIATVALYEQ